MSDQHVEGETLEAGLDPQFVPKPKSKKPYFVLAGAGVCVAALMVYAFSGNTEEETATRISSGPELTIQPSLKSDEEVVPAYLNTYRETSAKEAAQAREDGITYMPVTMLAAMEQETYTSEPEEPDVVAISAPEPAPAPAPAPVKRMVLAQPAPTPIARTEAPQKVPVQSQVASNSNGSQQQEPENPYLSTMTSQVSAMVGARKSSMQPPKPSSVQYTAPEADTNDVAVSDDAVTADGVVATANESSEKSLSILPGDVLFAEMRNTVSSDDPGVILAEVVMGDFAGARLIGTFSKNNAGDKLTVSFSKMVFNGKSIDISAYAIDGNTSESGIRSDIDRRYLKRYAPIAAAAFLQGFATSASAVGSSTTVSTTGTIVETVNASNEQNAYAGLAAATSAIAGDIAASSVKGPKVELEYGTGLGVIFVDELE